MCKSSDKPQIRLWSDQSAEVKELCRELEDCGYEVKSRFNGSRIPQAWTTGLISTGFHEIRLDFIG